MRRPVVTAWLVLSCLSTAAFALSAQSPNPQDKSRTIAVARSIMDKAHYCTLATVDADGQPRTRIVDPFPPEDDMAVWIATNPATRKVDQIRANPRVTLFYFDAASNRYVTLLGRAALVSDAAEKAKRWKPEWARLYKDANRGDDYLLIRVMPFHLEVLSPANGLMPDPKTWRPVEVDLPAR